jgi:hypothetical protein
LQLFSLASDYLNININLNFIGLLTAMGLTIQAATEADAK